MKGHEKTVFIAPTIMAVAIRKVFRGSPLQTVVSTWRNGREISASVVDLGDFVSRMRRLLRA